MDFEQKIDECAFDMPTTGVCTPPSIIKKLKRHINEIGGNSDADMIDKLKQRYGCKSEACILKQPEIRNAIGAEDAYIALLSFKPSGPRDSTEWLSNIEIDNILSQLSDKYADRHFYHIPFQMIDFEATQSELATMDWPHLYAEGYRTFGCVMNTDTSKGGGIHWFAIFGDFSDDADVYTVEYFNSAGDVPPDEVLVWLKKIKHKWRMNKPIHDVVVTRLVNQNDRHSCGPYSVYYILSRLDGTPYLFFRNNLIGDHRMMMFRKYLFRNEA